MAQSAFEILSITLNIKFISVPQVCPGPPRSAQVLPGSPRKSPTVSTKDCAAVMLGGNGWELSGRTWKNLGRVFLRKLGYINLSRDFLKKIVVNLVWFQSCKVCNR